jgi:hypothetical protein
VPLLEVVVEMVGEIVCPPQVGGYNRKENKRRDPDESGSMPPPL